MMITFMEAAGAGVSKGAIRKAALETQKLKAEKDTAPPLGGEGRRACAAFLAVPEVAK